MPPGTFAMRQTGVLRFGIAILIVEDVVRFWLFAVIIDIFVGPLQASSRSHMARVAPEHLRSQMFGLFTYCGKATAFVGPLLVGAVTGATASQRWGMSTIVVFFAVGFVLMLTVPTAEAAGREPG